MAPSSATAAVEAASLHIRLKAATPAHLRGAHNVELSIPQTSGRNALRKLLQHLLSLTVDTCPEFHFLANGEPLRTTFDKFLERRHLSAEKTLDVTYYLPLPEPQQRGPISCSSEWLSSVSVIEMGNTVNVLTGSYSGLPTVHCADDDGSVLIMDDNGHAAPIKDVTWLSTGSHFITASQDQTACVWSTNSENCNSEDKKTAVPCGIFRTQECGEPVSLSCVTVNNNDNETHQTLLGADDGTIWLLPDLSSVIKAKTMSASKTTTPSMKRKRVSLETIPAVRIGVGGETLPTTAVAWHGSDAVSAGWDSMVRMWDITSTSEKVAIPAGGKPIMNIATASNSFLVAAVDGAVRLVDPRDGKGVINACGRKNSHHGIVNDVTWLEPDRNCVSAGFDGSLRFWDVRTMLAPVRTVTDVHNGMQSFAVDALKRQESWCIFSAGADGKVAKITM